jgi:glucose-6-phosphate isomerase
MAKKQSSKDLKIDYNHVMADLIGRDNGLTMKDLKGLEKRTARIHKAMMAERERGGLAFAKLPFQRKHLAEIKKVAKRAAAFENLVVLGIGGSALGTRALVSSLCAPYHNLLARLKRKAPRIFVADNIDPDKFTALLEFCRPEGTVFNVISKSGGTAETMSQFLIVRNMLIKRLGKKGYQKRMIATTDPETGILRKIVNQDGLVSLPVPANVGGRFTVLSPVGLFPAAVLGIDISALLSGAARMEKRCREPGIPKNPAYLLGAILYLLYLRGRNIAVMMPYASSLLDLAEWFQQLWAESLGKTKLVRGKPVGVGTTPVRSLGVTDQHSQLQLYQDGPQDKLIIFVRSESFRNEASIPGGFPRIKGINYLAGHSLHELLLSEQQATEMALTKAERPNIRIVMPRIDALSMGQFIFLWEWTTAFAGALLKVNPFDQPGVDASKQYSLALLGRKGYEDMAREVRKFFPTRKRYQA